MASTRGIDYPTYTKRSFLFGVALLLVGTTGEVVGHALYESLPAWEETLFVDAQIVGILVALLAPLVFGVVLPLTE